MKQNILLYTGLIIMLAGCSIDPIPGSENVRITRQEPTNPPCIFLKEIQSDQFAAFGDTSLTYQNMITDLKNKAVKLDGNLIVIVDSNSNPSTRNQGATSDALANVYHCKNEVTPNLISNP